MDIGDIKRFAQSRLTDGLVLVVGSGLSHAEGLPDMQALAEHLKAAAGELKAGDAKTWQKIQAELVRGIGLEAALRSAGDLTPTLHAWLRGTIRERLASAERLVLTEVIVGGARTLRLTDFLSKITPGAGGIPIITPNYDRLVEIACERAGYHVDTTAIGQYGAGFDAQRSCMASCRGIKTRGKVSHLDHFPRAAVLKPHGSLDWYEHDQSPIRCSIDLDTPPLIIPPGGNKYKDGYKMPFDKHRDLANAHLDHATDLVIVGYGFNDDHLQTHLRQRVLGGIPTLILTREASAGVRDLVANATECLCLTEAAGAAGTEVAMGKDRFQIAMSNLWDLGVLVREALQ